MKSTVFFLFLVMAPAFAQSTELHADYDQVLKKYVTDGKVDYKRLKENRAQFDRYVNKIALVEKKEFSLRSQDSQLAYLINLYNAATLQLIIDHYPVQSIQKIGRFFRGPWDQPVVRLFGKSITLNNLEHDILGISSGDSISRMRVQADNWKVGKTLKELALQKEGSTILSLTRKIGGKEIMLLPDGDTVIEKDDLLTVYDRDVAMNGLFMRPAGSKGNKIHLLRVGQRETIKQIGNTEGKLAG